MKELREYRRQAQAARRKQARIDEALERRRNLLHHRQAQLTYLRRQGMAGTDEERRLLREIKSLENGIQKSVHSARALKASAAGSLEADRQAAPPWELVEGLNDHRPFLLLPVRIETRFMPVEDRKELWVRIFPDDIAVHTHEDALTSDEIEGGKAYWREIWRAGQESNVEGERIEKGAWRALAGAYGGPRAAWIRRQTRPEVVATPTVEDLQFPPFPEESIKGESWSQAPRSKVMPDCFVVMGFSDGREVFRVAGNPIPDPLMLGPDPQAEETELQQADGELLVGDNIAWIYDFQEAVRLGMGLQIPLEPPFDAQGLDQLIVLGLRLSSSVSESRDLVKELLELRSYAPEGLSLIPQGTPTNNTERQGSGFSSADAGAETSFAVETGRQQFELTDDPLEKRDGQRLVEGLGIPHGPFQRIQHAGRGDLRDALHMNRALWSGTLGYYLEEMLDLSLERIEQTRAFFSENVTGRGPLPAIRAGSQPYGILLASDFSRWKWSPELDGEQLPALEEILGVLRRVEAFMNGLIPGVARIGAPGDPSQNLLRTLGLQASSVQYFRRQGVGSEYMWNYMAFTPLSALDPFSERMRMIEMTRELGQRLARELKIDSDQIPTIFHLFFFFRHDLMQDPLVDDIPADEPEKLSETKQLPLLYMAPDPQNPDGATESNYIDWLASSPYQDIKNQRFVNAAGEAQPIPRPLLYRLLRTSLLQAVHDAALRLYTLRRFIPIEARREVELINIQIARTVTRWEFLDADISEMLPHISQKSNSVAGFLLSEEGLSRPESANLRRTIESIRALADLSTAQLERAFAEHIDLCSYRLDAWQTGCFNRRLQQQRFPPDSDGAFDKRVLGLYLGAFGWLEDLRPAPEPTVADLTAVPGALHDPQRDGPLFEQPDNAGFIHTPSLNHAVTAGVLRSAYLTHFDPAQPEKMAVNLSSERVRTALAFLEGVRNGQELGALLGYQFERGLHDRHGDQSLNQFISNFRRRYPSIADKITPAPEGEPIESKEARNVFDGYALLEAISFRDDPLDYPYDVAGLPAKGSPQGKAIQEEVARMADTLDALADLSLAEGIYQVTQGNFDRAGAMLKAMAQGESPAEPEIVRTPRGGTTITQRVALHLQTGAVPSPWPGPAGRRAMVEPGLNAWLSMHLPRPGRIHYTVRLGGEPPVEQTLADLGLQPIDLIYLIRDDLAGETTELESRIVFRNRRQQNDDALEVRIDFMVRAAEPQSVTLFELLPLLRALRQVVTSSRPLGADDYMLPSETTTNPVVDPNPQGIDLNEVRSRVQAALEAFAAAVEALESALPAPGADGQPDPDLANAANLRAALRDLADFGVPDAFPLSAVGGSAQAKSTLTRQAINILAVAQQNLKNARDYMAEADASSIVARDQAARRRAVAQAIFGPAFNLIPTFNLQNRAELRAATNFRDAAPPNDLTRHHRGNDLLVDEWLQGAAQVQPKLQRLETITILGEIFGDADVRPKPLQLPFREADHWVAVEYPEAFDPQGEFLSVVQALPVPEFQPGEPQCGLLIDEWTEVIPSKSETTGIAFHFNQPNSEPLQVCLLAVTPEVTGTWTWDKLVGILQNTLYRAKLRAVEPDQIGDSPLGHLLPTIIAPVTSRRFATITTDLIHQSAAQVGDDLT